jgi:hypothetical protein
MYSSPTMILVAHILKCSLQLRPNAFEPDVPSPVEVRSATEGLCHCRWFTNAAELVRPDDAGARKRGRRR